MINSLKYNLIAVASLMVLSLTSCVKKDIFYTPHPDKGAVVVTADWTEAPSETDVPQAWSFCINGGEVYQSVHPSQCYPELLAPGKYTLLVYNEPQGFTLNGTTAVVDSYSDGLLVAEPGYLYSATQELEVVKDDTLRVTVPMKRLLSAVSMKVTLDGESADVADIEASLSGVSGSVELATGEISESPQAVRLDVKTAETASRADAGKELELKCRILGVCVGYGQTLTVKIKNKDGHISSVTSDVTEELEKVNTDKQPVELEGSVSVSQDGHFSGTIDNWEIVSGGDVEAE